MPQLVRVSSQACEVSSPTKYASTAVSAGSELLHSRTVIREARSRAAATPPLRSAMRVELARVSSMARRNVTRAGLVGVLRAACAIRGATAATVSRARSCRLRDRGACARARASSASSSASDRARTSSAVRKARHTASASPRAIARSTAMRASNGAYRAERNRARHSGFADFDADAPDDRRSPRRQLLSRLAHRAWRAIPGTSDGVRIDAIEFESERGVLRGPPRADPRSLAGIVAAPGADARVSSSASARTSAFGDALQCVELRLGAAQIADDPQLRCDEHARARDACADSHRSAPTCADTRAPRRAGRASTRHWRRRAVCSRGRACLRLVPVRRSRRAGFRARARRRPCGNRGRPARPVRRARSASSPILVKSSSASVCSSSARSKSPSAIRQ